MTEQQSSYRQIFKATSIIGGVQILTIIAGIIKNKIAAVFIGTTGMGLIGLYNSPLNLITNFSSLGLNYSAVRFIAEANNSRDQAKIGKSVSVFKKLLKATGLLGLLITIVFSKQISLFTFGSEENQMGIVILSLVVFLNINSNGNKALLQGFRRINHLAKSTLAASLFSVSTAVPLFYFFGKDGIIPAILILSFGVFLFTSYFSAKIKTEKPKITRHDLLTEGTAMTRLGIMMIISGIITTGSGFILNAFIRQHAGIETVGLYTAGWMIVGQYVNIVFTAMGADYFPRLSEINHDNSKVRSLVNQQTIVSLLILLPLLLLLLLTMPIIVRLFLTKEFLDAVPFVNWLVFGIIFRALSWPIGYIFIAKNDSKTFIKNETIAGAFSLSAKLCLFWFLGLVGIGVSFLISYLFYFVLIYSISKKKYLFSYEKEFFKILLSVLLLCAMGFGATFVNQVVLKYLIGSIILALGILFSLNELNNRMDIKAIIKSKMKNKNGV